ncbi:MAG: DUF3016 domain-containing protein [Pseudoxanthomonas sp.]
MKSPALLSLALLAALPLAALAGNVTDADKPRSLPTEGPVAVSWNDPAQFSEIRYSHNRWEAERGDWVTQLAEYLRKSATKQLQPGERLEVNIVDVQRAGQYEPWRGPNFDNVRIVRDRYPPRMELSYTLYDANGQVLAQRDTKFSDMGFMLGSSPTNQSDLLSYEKRMIDNWVRRDLRAPRELSSR